MARLISSYILVARICSSIGNYTDMMVFIKKVEELCDKHNSKLMMFCLIIYIVRMLSAAGKVEYADYLVNKYDIRVQESFDVAYEEAHLALADLHRTGIARFVKISDILHSDYIGEGDCVNSFANSSADRSMRLIYDRHGIGFNDEIKIHDISEMLYMVDGFCYSMALHCIRVSNYSTVIGKGLNLTGREINLLWCASQLHDIGKLKIPREILNKPSKLTGEEYEIVKAHSRKGYELIRKMGGLSRKYTSCLSIMQKLMKEPCMSISELKRVHIFNGLKAL